MRRSFTIFALLAFALSVRAVPPDWLRMPAENFFQQAEANARIDPVTFDRALFSAAIFHQTNRQRQQLGLPAFRPLAKAAEAADLEASWGSITRMLEHRNPIPGLETAMDRARHTGLDPKAVGENLALTPIYDIGNSTTVGIRRDGLRNIYTNADTGAEAPVHTYATCAAYVVARWMNSPGHRANIVNPAYEYLGCSARPTKGVNGADLLYSVQLFAALRGPASDEVNVKPRR